jgi:galactokinase
MNIAEVQAAFRTLYEREPRLFRAPGRVNLIGEHTDYNDGFVLPMAIDRAMIVAGAARADRRVRIYSVNIDEQATFDLDHPGAPRQGTWLDYVEGTAQSLRQLLKDEAARLRGADLFLSSDIPTGGGLSSSAAIEVATGLALLSLSELEVDRKLLALAGQKAEHEYVGANVGIMDQWTSVFGKSGTALLLDCRTLETTYLPLDTTDMAIVVCDSHVKHELASSEYNKRRAECEQGVELLREFLPAIRALRDVTVAEFQQYETHLPEPIRRRCRHVVTENARTLKAAELLRIGNLQLLGPLMNESHQSLREDYEVSCPELDLLTDTAQQIEGVFGARLTGGGFGGCTVNVVRRTDLNRFTNEVTRAYQHVFGLAPSISVVEPSAGANEIV